ncbi:MAG TPA: replicative DNA helicase [Acidimicrobiales bacterium]|nr:replicative DNA helicase [Acidimicrobiales bacterium]
MADDVTSPRRPRGSRIPPHDLTAEESLLGAMMLEPEAIAAAAGVVRADDFYKPAHSHIFDAVHALYAAGQPVDPVTVADELRRSGLLETVGGHQVLVDVMASTPATTNAAGYARIVEEHALLRRLIGVAGEIAEIGYSVPEDVTKALDRAEAMVYDVNQRRVTDSTSKIEDLLGLNLDRLEQLYGRGDAITGVPTGYVDLDELLSGLQPSNLVVVGGRPSMGKCVAWDTPIVDPATGELITAADLHRSGLAGRPVAVLALADGGELRPVRPGAFVDDGRKPVYRVRTRSGREVRTTASHPFLTPSGWRPLADLATGQVVGVPAAIPVFGRESLPIDEALMLAHLVVAPGGDELGPRLWTDNPEVAADIEQRGAGYGVRIVDRPLPGGARTWDVVPSGAVADLADRHGIAGPPAERRVPRAVFRLPRDQLAPFLSRALGAAAAVWRPAGDEAGRVATTLRSPGLAHDLQHLLLRFGVGASVCSPVVAVDDTTWVAHELVVDDPRHIVALAREIGLLGHERELRALVAHASGVVEGHHQLRPELVSVGEARGPAPGVGAGPGVGAAPAAGRPDLDCPAVAWDEIAAIDYEGHEQVYDLTIPGWHNFVAADVFVHNTSFALGMAAHAALYANQPALVFSLEMGSLELSQRLLCGEARIDSARVRTGRLSEDDWSRISQAIGRLASAPIWIDDNPNLTVMEIRAKARRLKSQVGNLGMVVVDYLQLMSGRARAENRQVEVSEISRGLKILARELECPVVALSQLSRQLELRSDKRPMLADLRESGCVTGDTRVLRSDTGAEVTIRELADSGDRDIPVWSLDTDLRMVPATMTKAFPTGVKEVFELRLGSGRGITASANHPFLTVDGWLRLDELTVGSRIAVPRVIPEPKDAKEWPEHEVVLLAHLIGDGCVAPGQPIHYTSADPVCLATVEAAARRFGIEPRRVEQGSWSHVYMPSPVKLARGRRNPIAAWLDQWGLYGRRSHEKFVPAPVFALGDDQIALFLRHLWATDGCVGWWGQGRVYYASTSRRLVDDVRLLLLRLGIRSTLRTVKGSPGCPGHQLCIDGRDEQLGFLDRVGIVGSRRHGADELRGRVQAVVPNTNVDTVPVAVWRRVKEAMRDGAITARQLAAGLGTAYCGSTLYRHAPSRSRLARVAEIVDDGVLGALAASDVFWDRVIAIEACGPQPVFDATVESTHNFVANGISIENSIEQDADVVMFIYRDDVYHPDSPDRGQAEIIVSKHRNGPTGVTRLAFLEQFTRFANMARVD